MAEHKADYEFVEVKSQDILAERQELWAAFTSATKWSIVATAGLLLALLLFFG